MAYHRLKSQYARRLFGPVLSVLLCFTTVILSPTNCHPNTFENNWDFANDPPDFLNNEHVRNKVVQINLHPASSYIRRLEQQLKLLDEDMQISNEDNLLHADSHHLGYYEARDTNLIDGERDALQKQLQNAMLSMEGASAAYALAMEFPSLITQSPNEVENVSMGENLSGEHNMHQDRFSTDHSRYLREYSADIEEYERYRQYSRYEWALRTESDKNREDERLQYKDDVLSRDNGNETFGASHKVNVTESTPQTPTVNLKTTEVTAKKKGGLFNAYQTTPVHQGYGTHFATIWVGTPPQRKSVIIDTGSHYTAFPCKGCDNCGEEHHTDRHFDPDLSSTFHALNCMECQAANCMKGKCIFSQSCKWILVLFDFALL